MWRRREKKNVPRRAAAAAAAGAAAGARQACADPDRFCEGIAALVDRALAARLRLGAVRAGEILARALGLACEHRVGRRRQPLPPPLRRSR